MLELSEEAKRLQSTFLAYRNDIDIYTEDDEKDKEFYKVLFKRLLNDNITINDVTPLGSKKAVISRCEKEPNNGRKKLFIVDGDISLLHGERIPKLKHLFVLDAYCIENLVFDESSAINLIYRNCGTKGKEEVSKELDFKNWLGSYTEGLCQLFFHFALMDLFGLHFRLATIAKYQIKLGDSMVFSEEKVNEDIVILKSEILRHVNEEKYQQAYNRLLSQWNICLATLLTVVSGKDYLIPILVTKLRSFKKSNALPSVEEVKFNLAFHCDLDRLDNLKQTIENL